MILVRVGEKPCLNLKVVILADPHNGAQRSGQVRSAILSFAVNATVNDDQLAVFGLDDIGLHQTVFLRC